MSPNKPPITVSLTFDPEEMSRRGRIGAHRTHSRYDSRALTAPGRAAFLTRFEREVDPGGTLPEEERRRRAEHARKAYFAKLARLSAAARRAKKGATRQEPVARERAS
ncbi:MAG: hypothetical protein M3R02_30855 [Chloroflexota bacterium]|nr:hypothetical protein [Chloroflexota bacterium]